LAANDMARFSPSNRFQERNVNRLAAFAFAAAIMSATPALAVDVPLLHAAPSATATTLSAGVTQLSPHAIAYVPRSVASPAPLILFLHGSGTDARTIVDQYRGEADRHGAILLALDPAGGGWTLKPGVGDKTEFGADPTDIDAALAAVYAKAAIDPAKSVIVGHADGANYALAVGLTNPRLFHGMVAMSPSGLWLPSQVDKTQRIFLSHGMRDETVPFKYSRDKIVPGLQQAGLQVTTQWPNEGHDLDRRMVAAGLAATMGAGH
jgi:predicted esterase